MLGSFLKSAAVRTIVRSTRTVHTRREASSAASVEAANYSDQHVVENVRHKIFTGKVSIPQYFATPEPRPLQVADGNYYGALTATLAACVRGTSGIFVVGWRPTSQREEVWPGTLGVVRDGSAMLSTFRRPSQPIVLFDCEADAQCMLIREACSMLDLEVDVRPRSDAAAAGISCFLQNGTVSYEDSTSAIRFLFDAYGPGSAQVPLRLRGRLALATARLASAVRGNAGSMLAGNARRDRHLLQPLTLWGFEGSPFVRPVREALSSLGLRHTIINCARGSANRDRLYRKTGHFQVPYLEDPNTGVCMYESGEIVKYLQTAYTEDGMVKE